MASFPTAVTPSPTPETAPRAGASPAIKLAMLGQLIQGLAQQFPQAQQGIKMMLDGLRMVQSSSASASVERNVPAPPR